MSILPTVEKPAHVDPSLVVDFDFMQPGPPGGDPFAAWTRLHDLPPHGLDERSFANPLEVDLTRRDAYMHSTLSHGVHRCIGAPLALREIHIFLKERLARIPDFSLDADDPPVMVTGIAHGLSRLTLKWPVAAQAGIQ